VPSTDVGRSTRAGALTAAAARTAPGAFAREQLARRYSGIPAYLLGVAALGAAYYGAARAGLALAYLDGAVTALWPPVGVGVAGLVLLGARFWPGVVVGDLLVGDWSTPIGTVLGQTVGNTVSVLVAALLIRRFVGTRPRFERVPDVLWLVAASVVASGISAQFGVVSLWAGDVIAGDEVEAVWRTWWLGDMAGALAVTPFLLVWASAPRRPMSRALLAEAAALTVALVALSEGSHRWDPGLPYIVFPAVIWATLRFGQRGGTAAVALVTVITIWETAQGDGPFVRESITDSVLASQAFVIVSALTALVLAAVTLERASAAAALAGDIHRREQVELELRRREAAYRHLADEQAALRRLATLVAREGTPEQVLTQVAEEAARLLGGTSAHLIRFDGGNWGTVIGGWSAPGVDRAAIGTRVFFDSETAVTRVLRTGRPARLADYASVPGEHARRLVDNLGIRTGIAAPVKVAGQLWGAISLAGGGERSFPEHSENHLADFADLLGVALANSAARKELDASRARLVQIGDAERRRLERNLHDGAQQRLISLALALRLVETRLHSSPDEAAALVAAARDDLTHALEELRELARGIHPVILTERGLRPALEMLARRAPFDVDVQTPDERLPDAVEAVSYYIASEALANAAKYAQASQVDIRVEHGNGTVVVEVADDGVGGADPAAGSGLRGLVDRVEAVGGRLRITSPPGGGTTVAAEMPTSPV
jgi:signal transduction histidine kinase